jgi:hypothetical protein
MNRKLVVMIVTLMAVAMLALQISTVSAKKPATVSGKWYPIPGGGPIADPKVAGANAFSFLSVPGEYFEGSLKGSFVHTIITVQHYGEPERLPPSTFNWRIERNFTGTVDMGTGEKEGTLLIRLNAKGITPGTPGALKGTWVIVCGTRELENLHGQGTWTNSLPITGHPLVFSYEGQVHFDP